MAKAVINLQKESGGIVKISPVDGTGVTEVTVPESGNLVSVDTAVTDNAIARYDGATGKLQNSGVIIDDSGNITASNTDSTNGGSEAFSIKYTVGQKPNVISSTRSYSAWSIGFGVKPSGTTAGEFISTVDNVSWPRGTLLVDDTLKFLRAPSQNTTVGSTISMTEVFRTTTTGDLLLTSGTGGLGYGTGAGGTVTQLTSKSTAVTLNKPSGVIFTSNSALAAGGIVSFVLFNNTHTSIIDILNIQCVNSSNADKYNIWAANNGPGFGIVVFIKNISASTLSDVLTINFSIIKGANS